MKITNPAWYKLIKLLKTKGIITTGLTIPYVFGAYKILDKPFSSITELLQHIHNSTIDKYPVIQLCHEIHKHVIMVEKKEKCNKEYIKDSKIPNAKGDSILFISTNTNLGKTIEKVCSNLTVLYDMPIKREEFSWNNKEKTWQAFNNSEIELIKSIA